MPILMATPTPKVMAVTYRPSRIAAEARLIAQKHDDARSTRSPQVYDQVRYRQTCKARPASNKRKRGGSRAFIPWCKERRI